MKIVAEAKPIEVALALSEGTFSPDLRRAFRTDKRPLS